MCEEKIYHPVDDNMSTKMLNDLIIKKFIANYGTIVTEAEPLPNLGLKLFAVIVERN